MSEYSLPPRLFDVHSHVRPETLEERLKQMDESNTETALVMGTCTDSSNEAVQQCCRQHPDRFVMGAYIDPRQITRALEEVRRWHSEGVRIVKLFPNTGYYPDSDAVRPMFDLAAELKMGVLSHCGYLSPKAGATSSYYARPERFEILMRLYPDVPFILAHMGGISGYLETVMLTTRLKNAYVDFSPGQGTHVIQYGGPMAGTVPPEKLMWGADTVDPLPLLEKATKALVNLGYGEHFEKIFYSNAKGLFQRLGVLPA